MGRASIFGVGVLLLATAGAAAWWYFEHLQTPAPAPATAVRAPEPATPPAPAVPAIRFPIEPPQAEPAPNLPALDASDALVAETLARVFGNQVFREYFGTENLIRRIVVTVDNLPRDKLPRLMLPVRPVGGPFRVADQNGQPVIAADNAARYAPYVRLAEAVDSAALVAAYRGLYPLIQRAYAELGYPDAYFNDRLVEVIDHLLGAAPAAEPPRLVRPKIFYQFADPELESLSAGRRLLLRMGNDNAARIKAKLREVRALVATAPGTAPR